MEMPKLITAPILANATVFRMSSEFKLGITLKKVPLAVVTRDWLVGCIFLCIWLGSELTYRGYYAACYGQIAA